MPGILSPFMSGPMGPQAGPQSGFGSLFGGDNWLARTQRENPEVLLALGSGLMSGNLSQGFANAAPLMAAGRQRNATKAFLIKKGLSPEDADVVAANPALLADMLKGKRQNIVNAGDGQLYDADTGEWLTAPGAGGDYAKRAAAAIQFGLKPGDPAYQGFILTGKMPKEDQQSLTPTDKKAMWAAEDEIPILDNTIATLAKAKELNKKTYTGMGAGVLGTIGSTVPGAGYILDPEKANATREFGQLMSQEAIKTMSETLKGATTDFELRKFESILSDPSTPPDIRERTIDRMLTLAQRVKEVKTSRIQSINPDNPMGGAQPPQNDGVVDFKDYFGGQ